MIAAISVYRLDKFALTVNYLVLFLFVSLFFAFDFGFSSCFGTSLVLLTTSK